MVMFPVVALIISFLFEGMEPGWNIFAGVALVLLGNIQILRTKKEMPKAKTGIAIEEDFGQDADEPGFRNLTPSRAIRKQALR